MAPCFIKNPIKDHKNVPIKSICILSLPAHTSVLSKVISNFSLSFLQRLQERTTKTRIYNSITFFKISVLPVELSKKIINIHAFSCFRHVHICKVLCIVFKYLNYKAIYKFRIGIEHSGTFTKSSHWFIRQYFLWLFVSFIFSNVI